VLCAIDFSEASQRALEASLRITSGRVLVVHVLDIPHYVSPRMLGPLGGEGARPLSDIARHDADQKLAACLGQLEATLPGSAERVETQVLLGSPADALLRFAAQKSPDLLVIGTGQASLKKRLLGRVANRVVRGATCPVLTVPPAGFPKCERILVATDFSEAAREALHTASRLAAVHGASLEVVHVGPSPLVVPPEVAVGAPAADPLLGSSATAGAPMTWLEISQRVAEEEMQQLRQQAGEEGIDIGHCHVEFGNPAAKVLELLEHQPFDAVAVGTHGRRGLAHLMLGSVAESIIHHAQVPVLVAHRPAETTASGADGT
jgi:nucleotide-binding universal stress UspA family protein